MSFAPDPNDFLPKDGTHKKATVLIGPWNFDADHFYFPDTVEEDGKFFNENQNRTYRFRHASQCELAAYTEKTGNEIDEGSFLYCAIKCDASAYQMRYVVAERYGVIDDKESIARVAFEGRADD